MKILWLSHLIPYPPKGGVLQRSYHMLRELSKDHEVHVLAFNQKTLLSPLYGGDILRAKEDVHTALGSIFKYFKYFDIPCDQKRFGKGYLALKSLVNGKPYTISWLESDDYREELVKLLSENRYDLIHLDTISLDVYRNVLNNQLLVLDHHNIESHLLLRRARKEQSLMRKVYFYQEGWRLQNYERRVLKEYDGHITCSDLDSKRLLSLGDAKNVKVIPNGVDTDYFYPVGQNQKNEIIFVGTMNWYPNVEAVNFLIDRVVPTLRQYGLDFKLKIIGANPSNALINKAKSMEDVSVLGFVDDIRLHVDAAKVYVCPIMDGGGTKLKILDALAMGKAIVAHRIACEGIDVEDGRDVILAEEPDEYAKSISDLFKNDVRRKILGENARALAVEKYDYKGIGVALANYYKDIVGV